jgi:hypothetical protein
MHKWDLVKGLSDDAEVPGLALDMIKGKASEQEPEGAPEAEPAAPEA